MTLIYQEHIICKIIKVVVAEIFFYCIKLHENKSYKTLILSLALETHNN